MSARLPSRIWAAVRAADWWAYKIPPLLVTAYAGALLFDVRGTGWLPILAAFTAILLIAVYGYVLNDICDVEADSQSGRPNRMTNVGPGTRIALLIGPASGAVALVWTTGDLIMVGLVAANLALPTLYSVPPIRLKGRGILGALADAGGVHALPMALIARATALDSPGSQWLVATFVGSAIGWALFAGLRGIVIHQVLDHGADRLADVATFVGRIGVDRAKRLVFRTFLPLEVVSLTVFLSLVLPTAPVAAILVAIFVSLEITKVRLGWKLQLFDRTGTESYVPIVNNEVYEAWLPLAFALQLAVKIPALWLLLIVQTLAFWPNLRIRVRSVTALLPDSWFRRAWSGPVEPERRPSADYQVVVATTAWTVNGVNVFSANLVRQLVKDGMSAQIVITEQETDLVSSRENTMPLPDGVPIEFLPVGRRDGWGRHWGAMARYLEERAPCIYLPNHDWRHACVAPQLSNDVVIVGILHSDDPLHYDHLQRMGRYWNAIVAVSDAVAEKAIALCPELADRITAIPIGVRVPARRPARTSASERLRVIYHGILKQQQKRVLDLPRIVSAAIELGVPIELTIVGSGPDEAALRDAAQPLVEAGAVRFAGVISPDDMPAILMAHDVYVLASEFEGMPNALIEAMAHGLVPVVSRMTSGIPELIRDGKNGFMAPIGDAGAFARALLRLWSEPVLRDRMASKAFATVTKGRYRIQDMVRSYRKVFDRARSEARTGRFVRPRGPIARLPAEVSGIGIFPVDTPHVVDGLGAFPSIEDAEDYERQTRRANRTSPASQAAPPIPGTRVFVGAQSWSHSGISLWSEELVRGLRGAGVDASILLTEESTALVTNGDARMARPTDVPIEELEIGGADSWGSRWGALVRTLESAAPCIYIPGPDWRHAVVVPALSNRIAVIGVLHDAGPLSIDQVSRFGGVWNAVVATTRSTSDRVRIAEPALAARVSTIPSGLNVPGELTVKTWDGQTPSILVPFGDDAGTVSMAVAFATIPGITVVAVDPPDAEIPRLTAAGMRVVRHLNRQEWLALCEMSHFILDGANQRLETAVLEGMGRGCIPVVFDGDLPADVARRNVEAGLILRPGQWNEAGARLAAVAGDDERRRQLASRAHYLARRAAYRSDEMIGAFVELFERVLADVESEAFKRPASTIEPPPAEVEGISIFPSSVVPPHVIPGVGTFPSEGDAKDYEEHVRMIGAHPSRWRHIPPAAARASLAGKRVFVSVPAWTHNGLSLWAEDLVRGLAGSGMDARLLLTEESTPLINIDTPRMTRPTDIAVEELRVHGTDNWGARWGALVRLLEDAAPCIYIPNYDWRHSAITPLLSDGVAVIAVLHGTDELYIEHANRLGDSLNAVVAGSRDVALQARGRLESVRTLVAIPHGINVPAAVPSRARTRERAGHVLLVGIDGQATLEWARGLADLSARNGGPWQATVVDSEPELDELFAAAGAHVLRGLNREQWMGLCGETDIVVSVDSTHETRRRLLEAMGHGCVPVMAGPYAEGDTLVHDGVNGVVAPSGPSARAIAGIHALVTDIATWELVRARAHAAAQAEGYRADQMVETYLELFARVFAETDAGAFQRPAGGTLRPAPAELNGSSIFPVALEYPTVFGNFPTVDDARRFAEESGRVIQVEDAKEDVDSEVTSNGG